jgi:two-component system, chemotaxis family, chemotaxis protein CheY
MGKLVVFVDDSATVLMSAEMATDDLVASRVLELKTYSNPLDLLEDVKGGLRYDLLITDINMPQMNGLELAKELKSMDEIKMKPIIALTTENSPQMKQQGKQIGLIGWITKPFSNDKLIAGIKRVLKIR